MSRKKQLSILDLFVDLPKVFNENFDSPLHDEDTETQTFGCRHSRPDRCRNYRMPGHCSFAACSDGLCRCVPQRWKRRFRQMQEEEQTRKEEQKNRITFVFTSKVKNKKR